MKVTQNKPSKVPSLMSMAALIAAVLTSACGGGWVGGDSPSSGITLSGIAATGAPMAGAMIIVKDSTGSEVQSCAPCTVLTDGSFSIDLKLNAKGPFVLFATQDGSSEPEVSVVDTAQSTHINISPITTLVAASLASNGDPVQLSTSGLTAEKITQATQDIKTALKPLLDAAGVDANANPMTMAFKADSTGLDKALDALGKPNITRGSDGKTTVEVEIKTSGSDVANDASSTPAKVNLVSGSAPVATGLTAEKMQGALPADGTSSQISSLLQRMQDCYATTPASRRLDGATLASQITADVCKAIFVDNDPSKYLHNNAVVSQKNATLPTDQGGRFTGVFKGIFNAVQGMKFDLPQYRYTIKNGNTSDITKPMEGDVVFTARWTVTDPTLSTGQTDVGEYQARLQNGVLKLIGNQSKHDLSINAQARRDEMPVVPDYAYLSTGYNINIGERKWNHDNNPNTPNVSIYEQVVVTSPTGKAFTFKPIPGNNYEYLGLVRPVTPYPVTSSSTVRLNGVYLNAATAGHPSARFTKEFWGSAADWTDDKIAAIPAQGNWQFDITLTQAFADANPSTVANRMFTQYRRAINRAPTLAELKTVKWPALKDPAKTEFLSIAGSQGYINIGSNNSAESLNIDGWDVLSGAWEPTFAKVYSSSWDEGIEVRSNARQATILCTGSGTHCQKASGVNTGKFINTGFGLLQFTGRNNQRLQMSLNYSARLTSSDSN